MDPHALAERREVAAQLFEGVQEVRHPLFDHERVEGQIAPHVGAVVDEIPHHERALGEGGVIQHSSRVGGKVELRDLGRRADDPAVAGSLAVLEDPSPREGRDLAHRHGLGKEHSRVRVVARREIDQAQRDEEGIAVVGALELGDEFWPDGLDQHGFDVALPRPVLRVHREDDEVTDAVDTLPLRLELHERVEEVRDAESALDPAVEVPGEGVEVVAIVRECGCQLLDGAHDRPDVLAGGGVMRGIRNRAVGSLQRVQRLGCGLQRKPGRGHLDRGGDLGGREGSEGCGGRQGRHEASERRVVASLDFLRS